MKFVEQNKISTFKFISVFELFLDSANIPTDVSQQIYADSKKNGTRNMEHDEVIYSALIPSASLKVYNMDRQHNVKMSGYTREHLLLSETTYVDDKPTYIKVLTQW